MLNIAHNCFLPGCTWSSSSPLLFRVPIKSWFCRSIFWHSYDMAHSFETMLADCTLCLKKPHQLWSGIARNYKDRFWWHLAKHSKYSRIEFACFSFRVGLLFKIYFSSFESDTENYENFYAVGLSSKRANFDEVQFLKHTPKLIIFGKHNLQTFRHNTLTMNCC